MDEDFEKIEGFKVKSISDMDVNDLSSISAKVGQGSGVLFSNQWIKRDYTYILTANHNFNEEKKIMIEE